MAPLSELELERAAASGVGVHGHQTSRDSGQFTNTKGLLNGPGQNNCFLNSAVQVLWHLDIFRRSFRELSGHACMSEACIFCALKELFSQLQFSQESALPPDALRRALAETFFDQQRFQLGCMDDAAECFENILLRIHFHIAREEAEDMCNARHCIPHQKFAMTLVEQSVCDACKATSEPLPFTQMVHYVSASALTDQARQMAASSPAHSDLFGQLLRRAGGMGDIRDCPSNCGAKIQICRSLMNRPEIVSVGIVWDSERPTLDQIMAVFATVGTTLRLGDVFHSVVDQRWALSSQHALVGVVTYYGKHYSTFFFHTKLRLWIYFDDATVREVGPRWEQVVEKCRRGRYQPLLLLYAALGGTPVNTQEAPKFITPVTNLTTQTSPNRAHRASWAFHRNGAPAAGGQNQEPTHCAVHPNYPSQSGNNFSPQNSGTNYPPQSSSGNNYATQNGGPYYTANSQYNGQNYHQNGYHAMVPNNYRQSPNGGYHAQNGVSTPYLNGQQKGQYPQNGQYYPQNGDQGQGNPQMTNGYHQNGTTQYGQTASVYQSVPNGQNATGMYQCVPNGQNATGVYQSVAHGQNATGVYQCVPNGQPATGVYQSLSNGQYLRNGMPTAATQANYILRNATPPVGQVPHLPPLSPGRRAMTPSPEKPPPPLGAVGNSPTRRAVTPNPDGCKQTISDYQNLADMQAVIMAQAYQPPPNPLYRSNSVCGTLRKPVQRSNSSDSERSSVFTETEGGRGPGRGGTDPPRRRDSGNWSGDRNSASSSSSTSMENPYLYIVGKMQQRSSALPRSPLAKTDSNGHVDPGYDSYSLSSTDSLPLQQGLKHSLQLAQIPEIRAQMGQDCEGLCLEADELMDRGRILEEQGDLEAALVLVQAACGKSRAAMDAPYNNPGNISQARMKHNSCVVGLRSLQRKMAGDKDGTLEARHSRENSTSSLRSGGSKGNHSRQSSRDSSKGQHSRQSSRELLTHPNNPAAAPPNNNNTLNATNNNKIVREMLPQPVVGIHDLSEKSNNIEIYATLPKKKGGVMSRVRNRGSDSPTKNVIEDAEYLIYDRPGRKDKTSPTKEKRARSEERNKKPEIKPEPEPKVKSKQHKIRRKLLMGGLIKRKNRSMPDLREDEDLKVVNLKTQDDSSLKNTVAKKQLSGYLSEGHLEFSGNPNLERSRLMRKTIPVKGLTPPRVPPPPPLRTTSQLSKPKPKLSFMVRDDPVQYANVQGMVTRAEVHRPPADEDADLPPYPSPANSASHSRQASEEFPPPPEEVLKALTPSPQTQPQQPPQQGSFLLKELQAKLQQKVSKPEVSEDVVDFAPKESKSIKDLASRFEQMRTEEPQELKPTSNFTTSVLKLTGADEDTSGCGLVRRKSGGKKKNVTFCDQVVLVATADDDQDDSYIPNPILERVLRSAMNKDDVILPTAAETPMSQSMLQSRMQIPLCAPERSKPPPQYNPPPQCDAPRPYMQVPVRAFDPNGRGSVNQPDQSASVRLGVKSPYMPVPNHQLPQNKTPNYYHPLPSRLPQQGAPRPKIFPPYQPPPQPLKEVPNKLEPVRTNSVTEENFQQPQNSAARTNPCHLCRKKLVVLPAMYCPDCDFYMSRFRQKN